MKISEWIGVVGFAVTLIFAGIEFYKIKDQPLREKSQWEMMTPQEQEELTDRQRARLIESGRYNPYRDNAK